MRTVPRVGASEMVVASQEPQAGGQGTAVVPIAPIQLALNPNPLTQVQNLELKKKYETAVSGKSNVQGMIGQLEEYLVNVHTKVLQMIVQAQQSLRRLDEIALKPNPLTQVQYLELLIESEKNEAKPGWKYRMQYYEEAKRQAQILSKVKDVKAADQMIQEQAAIASGEKWYSRFKYWCPHE